MTAALIVGTFGLSRAAAADATLPCTQPQLAGSKATLFVVCAAAQQMLVSTSADGGASWQSAGRIPIDGVLSLGLRRGPRIAVTDGGIVVTAIVGAKGRGEDGDLLAWSSQDNGRSWSSPVRVNDVPGVAREGLHGLAGRGGVALVAWLDLRAGKTVHAASSKDGGRTWSRNVLAYKSPDLGVCDCCHPSVAIASDGTEYVMFRNAIAGARDMYVSRSRDGEHFESGQKLGLGTWMLDACPMDGGSISVDGRGEIVTSWRREETVYIARGTQSQEVALGSGRQPVVLALASGPAVVFETPEGLTMRTKTRDVVIDSRGRFASSLAVSNGAVVAWEREGQTYLRRLDVQ